MEKIQRVNKTSITKNQQNERYQELIRHTSLSVNKTDVTRKSKADVKNNQEDLWSSMILE